MESSYEGQHIHRPPPLHHSIVPSLHAFTLVELLVVIAIISILAALLMPALNKAKETGRRAACLSNIRTISMATRLYLDDNNSIMYPPTSNLYGHYTSTGNSPVGMGYLFSGNYIKDPKVFFCPSAVPITPPNWDIAGWTPAGFKICFANISVNSGVTGSNYTYNHPGLGSSPGTPNYFYDGITTAPFRIRDTGNENLPLLADAWVNLSDTQRYINHQKLGLNVTYLDGSARWVGATTSPNYGYFVTWGNVTNVAYWFWDWMKSH
ncbi:MAG: type II secretion system protein [Verrucomicrobia bacterium]|nr:type II secretion system protein [Verrucomicrobiota bacterium]